MSKEIRAERIRNVILENSTYEDRKFHVDNL